MLANRSFLGIDFVLMKALENSFSNKIFLAPAILTIAFFLVFLGMRTPNITKTSTSKAQVRAVVETQTKAAQTGIEKNGQTVDVCRHAGLVEPSLNRLSACYLEGSATPSTVVLTVSSRGPPALCA